MKLFLSLFFLINAVSAYSQAQVTYCKNQANNITFTVKLFYDRDISKETVLKMMAVDGEFPSELIEEAYDLYASDASITKEAVISGVNRKCMSLPYPIPTGAQDYFNDVEVSDVCMESLPIHTFLKNGYYDNAQVDILLLDLYNLEPSEAPVLLEWLKVCLQLKKRVSGKKLEDEIRSSCASLSKEKKLKIKLELQATRK